MLRWSGSIALITLLTACATPSPLIGWPSDRQPIDEPVTSRRSAPPFLPGEVLTYRATLAGLPAGQCEITIQNSSEPHELLISYAARSNPIVDLIYKVRDHAVVFTSPVEFRPRMLVMERESDARATIQFDAEEKLAILTRETQSGPRHFFLNTEDPRDPLSLVYYLRTVSAASGEDIPLEMVTTTGRTPLMLKHAGSADLILADVRYKTDKLIIETLKRPVGTAAKDAIKTGEFVVWRNQGKGHALLRGERQTPFGRLVIELVGSHVEGSEPWQESRVAAAVVAAASN